MGEVMIGVCMYAFVAILAGLLLHYIIGLYIEGTISGGVCAAIAGIYLGMLITIIITPIMTVRVVLFLLIVGTLILLPIVNQRLSNSENRAIDDENMESYRRAIERDPRNLAARERLAEALYDRGLLDQAIAEQSLVVQASSTGSPEARRLERMMAEREERKSPQVQCPSCGFTNHVERRQCSNCGGELSMGREIRKWLKEGGLRQIVITSSITMLGLVVLLLAFSALHVVFRILIAAVVLLIVVSAEFLYIQRNW